MRVHSLCRGALLGLWVFFLLATFCSADDNKVEVVGLGECADCKDGNIKTRQAVSGTILFSFSIFWAPCVTESELRSV